MKKSELAMERSQVLLSCLPLFVKPSVKFCPQPQPLPEHPTPCPCSDLACLIPFRPPDFLFKKCYPEPYNLPCYHHFLILSALTPLVIIIRWSLTLFAFDLIKFNCIKWHQKTLGWWRKMEIRYAYKLHRLSVYL